MPDINNPQNNDNNLGSPFINSAPSNPRNINYGVNIAQDFPYDPWENYEPLFDMYPRYKSQIQEAFNRGIPRRIIEKVFSERVEPRLNFIGTPEQVNSFLGRDEASQQRLRDYNEAKRFQTFREAFPDKSDQEISDAFAVSQSNGLSPHVLLQYPEIMKKIVDGRKLHETWYESIQRGASNYITQNNIANVGLEYWKGNITREQAYQQEKELSEKFIPEPVNTSTLNRFIEGGTKVATQGYYTLGKGTLYGAMLGTAGGMLGNLVGDPYHGAMAGYQVGQAWGSFEELFKLQAGADMLELSKMVDENGQPIDENAVRVAALITGAITTATEMITLKEALRILPGADKLLSLGTKENVKKALFIPQVRNALAEIIIDTSEGIGWSTVHNVIEILGTKAGIPIAQFFSQQPFPKQDLRIAESVIDTIVSSLRDFSAAALPKMLWRFAGVGNNLRQFNSQLHKTAKELGVSPDTLRASLEQAEIETRQLLEQKDNQPEIQQEQPTQEIQQTEQPVQEAQPEQQTVQQDVQPEQPTQEAQPEQHQTQQQHQQEAKKEYDYIFLPREELQTFINDHSDFADLSGITTATEIGLTQEQFDRIANLHPEFISSIMNDIRYGSDGHTITEANRKLALTDPDVADEFHSDENQAYVQNVTQQYSDNGVEQQEANDLALLWGANRASILAREGVDIALPKINQQITPQADPSRLSKEYDINIPDKWTNKERARRFKEALAWDKLPDAYSIVKDIFDYFRGKKPESADELESQIEGIFKRLKKEVPANVKSTIRDLARQEYNDYVETLRQANSDTIQSLNLKDNPDPTRYEFNSTFPKGKSRNPTEQYYFENFDGKTTVDLATDGTDLKVRIKSEGSKNTAVFSIRNYRDTNLHQVLSDVLGGFSINGIQLSETPAAMYLSQALRSFWEKFNLRKAEIQTQSYSPHIDVKTEHLPVEPRTNVDTHSLIPHVDVQTSSHTPTVDSVTEHYNLPDDLDTIAEDWKMQRAKTPAAVSRIIPDAEILRKAIKTHSTTDFDSMQLPKAKSSSPEIKVNVERFSIEDMPPDFKIILAAPEHEPSYYRAEEIKFNEDFVSPEFEQDNLLERDNPDYENVAPDENAPAETQNEINTPETKTITVKGNNVDIPVPVNKETGRHITVSCREIAQYWEGKSKQYWDEAAKKGLSGKEADDYIQKKHPGFTKDALMREINEQRDTILAADLIGTGRSRKEFLSALSHPTDLYPNGLIHEEHVLRNGVYMLLTDEVFLPQLNDDFKLALIHALEAKTNDELIERLAQLHPDTSQEDTTDNSQISNVYEQSQSAPEVEQADYSPEFNEENYSPDYEHNNAVLQDIPEQHIPDYETASPETKRENMPDAARFRLAQDEQAWHKTVDAVLNDDSIKAEGKGRHPIYAMKTPLVFSLVGVHTPAMELNIDQEKIKLVLEKHSDMTPSQIKDMARALTDPIAIFESSTRKNSVEVLTDLKGEEGFEVLVAVNLNQEKGTINKIDSAYPKVDRRWRGTQPYRHYQDAAVKGHMLYLNTQKATVWAQSSGVDLSAYAQGVKTETDLINLWNKHKEQGYYYTDKEGNPIAFTQWKYGRAVIEFLQNTHTAANVHEFGHAAFFLMQALEKQGSIGMKDDIDIILKHAGVTREAFDADVHRAKGGAREQAHEYFAKAFEQYISEGKAPTKKLQPVFNRLRNKLLEFYDVMNVQLGIQLDDEIRGVFDRLLTLPGEETDTVADSVLNEIRVENQIDAYAKQQADIQTQTEESLKAQREYELKPQDLQIDEQAADFAYNWVNEKDWVGIQDEEYQVKREQIDYIISKLNNQGGISYRSLWEYMVGLPYGTKLEGRLEHLKGTAQRAHDLYNKWRRLFAKGYLSYDVAESIALRNDESYTSENLLDYNSLEEFLEDVSPVRDDDAPQMIPPKTKVDTNLVNAFLAGYGIDEAVSYLQTRKDYLEGKKNQTDEIKAELTEINEWLKRLDSKEPFDEELANPHKRSKKNISKRDLRRAASTGYKMGEGKERALQELKSAVREQQIQEKYEAQLQSQQERSDDILQSQLQSQQEKYEAQLQSQQDKSDAKLQAIIERNAKREQALRDSFAARKEKDNARFEAFKQKAKETREADKSKHQDRLMRITQTLKDRDNSKIQRIKQQAQRKIDRLQQRIDNLRAARDSRSQKAKINRLVKGIARMSNAKNISVASLHEINDLLKNYDLDKRKSHRELRDEIRKFLDLAEMPAVNEEGSQIDGINEAGLTQQDIEDFLSKIHIEDMTLQDVQVLHHAVSDIYEQGRRDFEIWKKERDNRRADMRQKLSEPLLKLKAPDKTVITDRDDLNRKYKLFGRFDVSSPRQLAREFWDAVQTPGRFLASLGEEFRNLFEDGFTSRRDNAYSFINQRKILMLASLKQLGFNLGDFAKPAIEIDGKVYSWEECHAIWNAFKNDKAKLAVLWGNFIQNQSGVEKLYSTQDEAMTAINKIFQLMHDNHNHIQAAELILQELEDNFSRLQQAGAEHFNTDIHHEDNYSPIIRLRHMTKQGTIDTDIEKLAMEGSNAQVMRKVENGFTQSRADINPMFQQPVDLHAWANWLDAVTEQEYYIHIAGYAADLQSAMLQRDENGYSVMELIKSRRGNEDWVTLRDIFNTSITDKSISESEAARSIANWLLRSRSFAYIPFRPFSAAVQSASYMMLFPYSTHGHMFRTLAKLIQFGSQGRYQEFMENIFQKAPELRFASGDFTNQQYERELRQMKSIPAGIRNALANWGYGGVRFFDRITKALVFHAAYESNIENGMTEDDAVRLANRAVRDTQPASSKREATRLNRTSGWARFLLTQFMSPQAPIFNMAVVDVLRGLSSKSWNGVKSAACSFIGAALAIYFTQFMRDTFYRNLPDGEEDDYGNINDWGGWFKNSLAEGLINSLPLFNNSFLAIKRMFQGKRYYNENRLDAPFVAFAKAWNYATNDDYEGEYNGKAISELIKGLALIGVPLPYAGIRDFIRIFFPDNE